MNKHVFISIKLPVIIGMIMMIFTPTSGEPSSVPRKIVSEDTNAKRVYEWVKALQLPNGLLESSDGSNFVSLYENALAAIVFCACDDAARAEKIFDFFNQRMMDELMRLPGGFGQFRNASGVPTKGGPHRWLGDNAWLLIALNNYNYMTGSTKYTMLCDELEYWIRSLQDKKTGGLYGGYNIDGSQIWMSTEGTIDAFNAVPGYDSFHKDILHCLESEYWDPREKAFLAWKEHDKYKYALDLHSWGYCAFSRAPVSILKGADKYCITKKATINNKDITGFSFDLDLDTVWLEGTAEMVVAYNSAGMDGKAKYYLRQLEEMITPSSKNPDLGGIPYVTNPGTHYGDSELWGGADRYLSLASSAWYLLGKIGCDPMKVGRKKKIPRRDLEFFRGGHE